MAAVGESVIGVVTGRQGESFKVDIGTAQIAQLSQYAFEGATKQMKPRLEVSPPRVFSLRTQHSLMDFVG